MTKKNINDSLMVGFKDVQATLKTLLSDYRYHHSLLVAHECADLATHYYKECGLDSDVLKQRVEEAFLVGLIHDTAKELDISQLDLPFTDFHLSLFQSFPSIAHAFALDVVVPVYFSDIPKNVIQAAIWHTTGRADMSELEKIVFIADFIEPERTYKNRQFIYDLAYQSLDNAVFEIAFYKLSSLLQSKKRIYLKLVDCYNFYSYNLI